MGDKQVRANQKGFYKDRLVQEGEVFLVSKGETALWFDDVAPSAPTGTGETDQGDKPPAYSRMNKGELIVEAAKLGIELTGEETNPQIVELLTAKQSQE